MNTLPTLHTLSYFRVRVRSGGRCPGILILHSQVIRQHQHPQPPHQEKSHPTSLTYSGGQLWRRDCRNGSCSCERRLVYNCVSMIGHSSKTTASNPRNLVIRYVQKLHYTSSSICRPCRLFLRCYSKSVPIICSFALIPTSARKKFCQSVNFPSCQSVLPPVRYMLSPCIRPRAYRGYRYPWIYLCVDTRLRLYPILGF